jgi:hypothetical protein
LALAQQEFAEAWPAKAQQHPQTQCRVLKSRPLPTKPEIFCKSKLRHLDELVLDAQTACTLEADVRCLVGIADPCTSRLSGIADCRLFSTALDLLVHRLFGAAGAEHSAVG